MSALITGKSIRTNNGDRAELPARQQFPLANQDAALAVRIAPLETLPTPCDRSPSTSSDVVEFGAPC
jgi:hypothetical protein